MLVYGKNDGSPKIPLYIIYPSKGDDDGDGIPDHLDNDDDGDGIPDNAGMNKKT